MKGNRFALLIGNSRYEYLPKLASPENNVNELKNILGDRDRGGFVVDALIDANREEVIEKIGSFLNRERKPDDLLFLYFSGHGIVDEKKRLYITTVESEGHENKLDLTSISADIIRKKIEDCRSRNKVLILDCCFSGAIFEGMVRDQPAIRYKPIDFEGITGLFFLTSSSELQPAFEEKIECLETKSKYTGLMIRGLKGEADDDGDSNITLDELHSFISNNIDGPQKPMKTILGGVQDIVLTRKPTPKCTVDFSTDPILESRINALKRVLEEIRESPFDWGEYFEKINFAVPETVLDGLNQARGQKGYENQNQLEGVCNIIQKLKDNNNSQEKAKILNKAWTEYLMVYTDTKNFFDEYLEFIGALAFRNFVFQNEIYKLADELISDCLALSTSYRQNLSPSVPVSPETIIKIYARIIGLHFSQCSIWTLPLAVHELGHVMIEQNKIIKGFVDSHPLFKGSKENQEILADAYALFLLGPAYACSCIYFSLNPNSDFDIKRAKAIFSILKLMNENTKKGRPYDEILGRLKSDWNNFAFMSRSSTVETNENGDLQQLISNIWASFTKSVTILPMSAQYPAARNQDGWMKAQEWKQEYDTNRGAFDQENMPKVIKTNKIRDILNAIWLCRLLPWGNDSDENISQYEDFAKTLHKELEKAKSKKEKDDVTGSPKGKPGSKPENRKDSPLTKMKKGS